MAAYDFGAVGIDIVALGRIFAEKVGQAYNQSTTDAQAISKDAGANAQGINDAGKDGVEGNADDAQTFDVGKMANFMLNMMIFGTLLKILFSITALIKDFGDFAAQKM